MYEITDLGVQQMLLFGMYTILAGNSILIYDHIVTLPEEIAFIWRRPKALPAMLFLLNRYFALLANISSLVVDFRPIISDERSDSLWTCVVLLNKSLAVQNIRYTDNWPFSSRESSFPS